VSVKLGKRTEKYGSRRLGKQWRSTVQKLQ
jgi:hypothetical protein